MYVALVFQMAGGRHHAEEGQLPVAMKRKLKFLRLCMRKIEILSPFRDEGLRLLATAGTLAGKRNGIVHGFLSEVQQSTLTFTFTALGSVRDQPLITGQANYTMQQLVEIGTATMSFAGEFIGFVQRLRQALVAENP